MRTGAGEGGARTIAGWRRRLAAAAGGQGRWSLAGQMLRHGLARIDAFAESCRQGGCGAEARRGFAEWVGGFALRMREGTAFYRGQSGAAKAGGRVPVREIQVDFRYAYPPGRELVQGFRTFEVLDERGRAFAAAMAGLMGYFPFAEIDPPPVLQGALRAGRLGQTLVEWPGKRPFHARYVLLATRDGRGRTVAAADGALVADARHTLFYGAHIWVDPRVRQGGVGRLTEAALLTAAAGHVPEALGALGRKPGAGGASGLEWFLGETEFGSLAPGDAEETFARLMYHGRTGKKVLWPLAYAQPDTNWRRPRFDAARWESLPLFILVRRFGGEQERIVRACGLDLVELMLDSFKRPETAEGVEFDIRYMRERTPERDPLELVELPASAEDIPRFVRRVGDARRILVSMFPSHALARRWLAARPGGEDLDLCEVAARVGARGRAV